MLRCERSNSFVATVVTASFLGCLAVMLTVGAFAGAGLFPVPAMVAVALLGWGLAIGGSLLSWRVSNRWQDRNDLVIDRSGLRLHAGRHLPWPPSPDYFTRHTRVMHQDIDTPSSTTVLTQRVSLLAPDGATVELQALDVIAETEDSGIELSQGLVREVWSFGAWVGAVRPLAPGGAPGGAPHPYHS